MPVTNVYSSYYVYCILRINRLQTGKMQNFLQSKYNTQKVNKVQYIEKNKLNYVFISYCAFPPRIG